jgi:hypothetical protein
MNLLVNQIINVYHQMLFVMAFKYRISFHRMLFSLYFRSSIKDCADESDESSTTCRMIKTKIF